MTSMILDWLGGNALAAAALAVLALIVQRVAPWPSLRHAAWALVLLRLLVPPVVPVSLPDFLPVPPETMSAAGVSSTAMETTTPFDRLPAPELLAPPAGFRAAVSRGTPPTDASALASPESVAATRPALPTILLALEIAGALALIALTTHRIRRLRRCLADTIPAEEPLRERADLLARRLGLKRAPELRIAADLVPPMLLALPRACIVLPRALVRRLSPPELDAVLAHELVHAKRGDHRLRWLELAAGIVYWWLPFVPWVRTRLRLAEEAACDAEVVRLLPGSRRDYANGLLGTLELVSASTATPGLATGAADSRNLQERLVMILQSGSQRSLPRKLLAPALPVALALISFSPTWIGAAVEGGKAPAPPAAEAPRPLTVSAPRAPVVLVPAAPAVPAARAPYAVGRGVRIVATTSEAPVDGGARELADVAMELHRQLIELERQTAAVQARLREVELEREVAELVRMRAFGEGEDLELLEAERARALERLEIERKFVGEEAELRQRELELRLLTEEHHLQYQLADREGNEERQRELAVEMLKLEGEMDELQLRRLELDGARQKAELDARRAELEARRESLRSDEER